MTIVIDIFLTFQTKLTKDDLDLRLTDLEEAAAKLLCDSDSDSDLDEQFSKMAINKNRNAVVAANGAIPADLLVAAEAARMSSSESELDSDDLSSEESEDSEDSTDDSSEESD